MALSDVGHISRGPVADAVEPLGIGVRREAALGASSHKEQTPCAPTFSRIAALDSGTG